MINDKQDLHFNVILKLYDFLDFFSAEERKGCLPLLDGTVMLARKLGSLIPNKELNNLFISVNPDRMVELIERGTKLDPAYRPPNFLNYYSIECNSETEATEMVELLTHQDEIELVYIESHSACAPSDNSSNNPLSLYQEYLNPAPLGIDARYAWEFSGGNGKGNIKFIDIEQGWQFNHEDIKVNQFATTGISHWQHSDHGTAVLGVIMMRDNELGGIGITPEVSGYVISQWRPDGRFNTADAIMAAIDHLEFGDILLLEAQSFDILNTRQIWPVEMLDATFHAIRLATALGIVVVEAAGNGMYQIGNNLDHFTTKNGEYIFNRSNTHFKDSGAVIVAAASVNARHSKINSSNYGSRVDCFAWGENVVTAGLYPRCSGASRSTYTNRFCGTSSASAIIAGAAIALQSITEAKYGFRLGPVQMRDILSNELYGTTSLNGHSVDKIGVMPDLKKIIDQALNFIPLPDRREQQKKKSLTSAASKL